MSGDGDQQLMALISREQRGFRFILFSGLFMLVVLVGTSAALGFYYYTASRDIAELVERQTFDIRRDIDNQRNRVAAQDMRLRRVHAEVRGASTARLAPAPQQMQAALESAGAYLERGRLSFSDEQMIDAIARDANAEATPARAFLTGVARLAEFERSGDPSLNGRPALPQTLLDAKSAFESAASDTTLAQVAQAGLAYISFYDAQRTAYGQRECEHLFGVIAASGSLATSPQPLYWQAQCERKLGRTVDSLLHYAQALEQSAAQASNPNADFADLSLAMNAFHGVGTTLIALYDEDEARIASALAIADQKCSASPDLEGSPRMQLAERCLRDAMRLRRQLGQTPNQVNGSGENLSFVYLRDGNFAHAFAHANEVEHNGILAWTELVRAFSADNVARSDEAHSVGVQARRRISFFDVADFNLCELQRLLSVAHYEAAVRIIEREHPGERVGCATSTP